jgi:hypothetical protein
MHKNREWFRFLRMVERKIELYAMKRCFESKTKTCAKFMKRFHIGIIGPSERFLCVRYKYSSAKNFNFVRELKRSSMTKDSQQCFLLVNEGKCSATRWIYRYHLESGLDPKRTESLAQSARA